MKGRLIRMAVAYDEDGQPTVVDVVHGRAGTLTFEDGESEPTLKPVNLSLQPDDLSAGTRKLLHSLGESLTADATARLKKDIADRQQAAADQVTATKRLAVEAQEAEKRAVEEAQVAAERAREAEQRALGG